MKDHSIIFFPLVDWDDPWQRYQHFALLFSKKNHVIYLNSPAAITYFVRNPLNLFKKWFQFIRGKKRISSKLSIYDPFPCLPFGRGSRWVNRLNQHILSLYIKIFVRPKGRLILWINNPYYSLMTRLLKPKIAVYDCPDAIIFKDNKKKQMVYDELKKQVLQESTVSLFTSKALLEEGERFSRNCFYVPNGVDVQNFNRTGGQRPKDMMGLTGKIVGVVGTFDERIDIELMSFALENIRDVTFALVGPIQVNMRDLANHHRVFIAGKRRYEEIPAFIETFDVALIPYRLNEVTRAVYPVKLHEYLILGKPVVATNLPELEQFSDIIWIAKTKEEFTEYIMASLNESQDGIRRKRIDRAKANSWDARINQITEILHNYL